MTAGCFRCDGDCNHSGCVKRIPVFASLSQSELEEISQLITRKNFPTKMLFFMKAINSPLCIWCGMVI